MALFAARSPRMRAATGRKGGVWLDLGRAGAAAAVLCLPVLFWLEAATAADTTIIALTVAQSDLATSNNTSSTNVTSTDESSGYFPLGKPLESVMRLAADDINGGAGASLGLTEGKLLLQVVGVNSGTQAMEGFCNALEDVGENGTFGVSESPSYSLALPPSLSPSEKLCVS